MAAQTSISTHKLRQAVIQILDFIERNTAGENVALSENLYWEIGDAERYNLSESPANLECGSLIDDWEFVEDALKNDNEMVPLMLIHIAPLLRYLATHTESYNG